jgi:hypothetical protein
MHASQGPRITVCHRSGRGTVVSRRLCRTGGSISQQTDLGRALEMFDAVPIDVVMRSNGLTEFRTDHHTWALCSWTTCEEHDPCAGVGERCLPRGVKGTGYVNGSGQTIFSMPKTETRNAVPNRGPALTSNNETATFIATPVHLNALLSLATGQGSLVNPSKI